LISLRRCGSALALAAAAGLLSCGGSVGDVTRVVLVTLDTTRADRIGCYGAQDAATPNLDRLAREGVLFEQAGSPVACTLPSHTTMFTGLYPPATGVHYNTIFKLAPRFTTLAERLGEAGFETAAFVAAFPLDPAFGLDQGFDLYDAPQAEEGSKGVARERTADDIVDRALEWMTSGSDGPRFAWLHIWDPHAPYAPPFPFSDRFRDRPYDGEVAFADSELGRLFEFIETTPGWERALVIVVGDHGEGLYDHGEQLHSLLAYESTLRVPLIVRAPGVKAGHRVAEPVTLADIAPTIADLTGLSEAVSEMNGISLRPALGGDRLPRRDLFVEALAGSIVHGWSSIEGIRSGNWKYLDSVSPELFDLGSDPGEEENLIDVEPQRAQQLAAALSSLKETVSVSAAAGSDSAPVLDPDLHARLAALGYVGGANAGEASKEGPSPRDLVYLEGEMSSAQMLFWLERWDDAVETTSYILEKDPTNRFALYGHALSLSRLEQWDEALAAIDELLRQYDDSADFFDLKGQILMASGRGPEAAEAFEVGLAKFPSSEALSYHEVLALYESGSVGRACDEVLPGALDRVTSRGRLLVAQARCRVNRGDIEGARESLQAAVDAGFTDLEGLSEIPDFDVLRRGQRTPIPAASRTGSES
jgi:arylsulfatase A-like enzyme